MDLTTHVKRAKLRCDENGNVIHPKWGHPPGEAPDAHARKAAALVAVPKAEQDTEEADLARASKDLAEAMAKVRREAESAHFLASSVASEEIRHALEAIRSTAFDPERAEEVAEWLTFLEELVHDHAAAADFTGLKGFSVVIDCLGSPSAEVRKMALWVLGTATQNNEKMQGAALKAGVLEAVVRCMQSETSNEVQRKAVYALSSLLRNNEQGQQQLLDLPTGLAVFSSAARSDNFASLRPKFVAFLRDILEEDGSLTARWHERLAENGWCKLLGTPEWVKLHDDDDELKRFVAEYVVRCVLGGQHAANPRGLEYRELEK